MPPKLGEAELANPTNDAERQEALLRCKSLALTDYYPRPGFGTTGRPITVLANQFQARFQGQGKTIYHYDVEINPVVKVQNQKKPVGLLRDVWARLHGECSSPEAKAWYEAGAYDGRKNFFTPFILDKNAGKAKQEFTVTLPDADPKPGVPPEEQGRRFTIEIKQVADIDLDSISQFCEGKRQSIQNIETMLTAFMSVNVLLRSNLHQKYTSSGAQERRFFTMEDATPISNGAVVAKGFAQSFRPSIGFPSIQLDTAYSAFVAPGPLVEVAKGLLGRGGGAGFRGGRGGPRGRGGPMDRGRGGAGRGGFGGPPAPSGDLQTLSQFDVQKLRKTLFGAKFKVIHRTPNKVMSFVSLTLKSAEELTFTKDDGTKQSVAEYIQATYNKPLQFPRLPCVVTGKKTYIPMELVVIMPFHSLPPLKLTPDQTAEMIKISARPPADRRDNIMAWRKKLAWETRPEVNAWGLQIRPDFTQVPARVLNPPQVAYGGGPRGIVRPAGGAWNLRGKQFFKPGQPLTAWSVISFERYFDIQAMQGFITFFVKQLRTCGINVANERPPCLGPFNPMNRGQGNPVFDALNQGARAAFEAGQRRGPPQLIVVILPSREVPLYEEIKRSATRLNAPVPTQCLQAKKLQSDRGLDQYCANVGMKVNAKLGGINVSIPLSELPGVTNKTMLIGADVGHPPQGNGPIRPSIAATVASINGDNNSFKPCVRLQEGRSEPIAEIGSMVTSHLKEFEANTRTLPDSIVMFRDGVSESQYAAIVEIECKSIMEAAAKIKPGYQPKLCFVIVAKRHSMRFFASNQNDVDRSGNLPAGTVVDSVVTHPFAFDFYLQAHAGLVGTARPTHLVCLRNDMEFKVDELQRLANALSYNFQRATRSVSVVSLAYYADIICTATRSMVYDNDGSDYEPTESGATSTSDGPKKPEIESFDSMKIQQLIEKGGAFNKVQWYM